MLNELNKIWENVLTFEQHKFNKAKHFQSTKNLKNGYSISVLFGSWFYSNGKNTYEVGILKDNKLCYDTSITNDVLGYLTKDEIIKVIDQVNKLNK